MVSIHTQWFDQDGSPLPEALEGYTGRMAKVSAPNTLAAEGGGTGTFPITPGEHQQGSTNKRALTRRALTRHPS